MTHMDVNTDGLRQVEKALDGLADSADKSAATFDNALRSPLIIGPGTTDSECATQASYSSDQSQLQKAEVDKLLTGFQSVGKALRRTAETLGRSAQHYDDTESGNAGGFRS